MDPPFLRRAAQSVSVELRVRPRARRTALSLTDGALAASVTAPPEHGKANAAVISLLANCWRLPISRFAVIKGATMRDKVVCMAGEPAMLADRIVEWVQKNG